MAKRILALGASSSRQSINKQLATYAAGCIANAEIDLVDLNDYEMPIYGIDRERENGIPQLAKDFKAKVLAADGIVISFAEHNGAYATAFKNVLDWISRIDKDVWGQKPMFLLATSPGARGGQTVLDIAVNKFKFMNQNTIVSFSLPSFTQNFSDGIKDETLKASFMEQLQAFEQVL